jgi:hypothetical protein
LFQARAEFDARSPTADDLVRSIRELGPDALQQAVEQCIEAAGHEAETDVQQRLLRAARFGMDFLDAPPPSFAVMCQQLRVLHHVRDYKVGMPLTHRQLQLLTVEALVDRLIARGVFWLAFEVCRYLKLRGRSATNRVLVHWAGKMVALDANEDLIASTIVAKLGPVPGISFAEVARQAVSQNRPTLALMLLEHEPAASEQVPLLVAMKEDARALDAAIASGDTDLVVFVLMHLQATMSKGDFLRVVHGRPEVHGSFVAFATQTDRELLADFYFQHDNQHRAGCLQLQDAFRASSGFEQRQAALKTAARTFGETTAPAVQFLARTTEDEILLQQAQRNLSDQWKIDLMGKPLGALLTECVRQNDQTRAEKLRKDFKVPDKRFWWIKVRALAEANNYAELERFSKSKKSPIGYRPFVDECIARNNRFEAKKYIVKLNPDERVAAYVQIACVLLRKM